MATRMLKGAALAVAVGAAMGPEWRTGTTKPRALAGVPAHDYQDSSRLSKIEMVPSLSAVLREARPPSPAPGLRSFALSKPELVLDHCKLSRFSVTFLDDGGYTVSLRAEQNASFEAAKPMAGGGGTSPLGAVPKAGSRTELVSTGHLKRNEFHVTLTCYGAPSGTANDALVPGPALMTIDLTPFMVQRGEPVERFITGFNPWSAKLYPLVDRVEVGFRYK